MLLPPLGTVTRAAMTVGASAVTPALVAPSVCTPADTGVGRCFDQNGWVPGRFNCAACCALRGAAGWVGDNGNVAAC